MGAKGTEPLRAGEYFKTWSVFSVRVGASGDWGGVGCSSQQRKGRHPQVEIGREGAKEGRKEQDTATPFGDCFLFLRIEEASAPFGHDLAP